jgi:hypothetical protein
VRVPNDVLDSNWPAKLGCFLPSRQGGLCVRNSCGEVVDLEDRGG